MLRAALQPHAVVGAIEPLVRRSATPICRLYSDLSSSSPGAGPSRPIVKPTAPNRAGPTPSRSLASKPRTLDRPSLNDQASASAAPRSHDNGFPSKPPSRSFEDSPVVDEAAAQDIVSEHDSFSAAEAELAGHAPREGPSSIPAEEHDDLDKDFDDDAEAEPWVDQLPETKERAPLEISPDLTGLAQRRADALAQQERIAPPAPPGEEHNTHFKKNLNGFNFKTGSLHSARKLLAQLVAWPDHHRVFDEDDPVPDLKQTPETLVLLGDFTRRLRAEQRKDPLLLLLALRGFTAFADESHTAEGERAAVERQILAEKSGWWVGVTTGYGLMDVPGTLSTAEAGVCLFSADFIRRHPLYADRPEVCTAWDGQPTPASVVAHRRRLHRVVSSVLGKMRAAELPPPNVSGLPDLPHADVSAFLRPALAHAGSDAFVLLFALHLLAATFNTALAGRVQAVELVESLEAVRPLLQSSGDKLVWRGIDLQETRDMYELALVSFDQLRPVLHAHQRMFVKPIRDTYEWILQAEGLKTPLAQDREHAFAMNPRVSDGRHERSSRVDA